ncbi:hypothetical protein [Tardiphaga sp. 709]|uniref:hypothetical protein n=1 Tax=Tardiphaga sp. 709 TaxID=3076039 RepID=UPI0028E2C753|nr:hypothetical protein [Tardiphaga sp. 709]WNV10722.1 hypothetical protein RSO67_05910 [Tardiphaga sp. 709]
MDLKLISTTTAAAMHSKIQECLDADDQNALLGQKRDWCVRDTPDWKQMGDELEEILRSRSIGFRAINWSAK